MFYFYHGTNIDSLDNILKKRYIYPSNMIDKKYTKVLPGSKYIFFNIINNNIIDTFENRDELIALGEITIIIDPLVLKYKKAILNFNWSKEPTPKSLVLNDTDIDNVFDKLISIYKYPYIMTHEVIFTDSINIKFIIGIVVPNPVLINSNNNSYKENYNIVKKILKKYKLDHIKIFKSMPKLVE